MKLSRIYSNQAQKFHAIDFVDGLNVVLAEIRLPENKDKDTHNLGKTTLARLIDFCLLNSRNKQFFLFRHEDLFHEFVFYLEIRLRSGDYVTVRRSVAEPSRINFKQHGLPGQDFSMLPSEEWDHDRVPFDRAKELLDGLLNLGAVKPWSYRKGIGYQLRLPEDYTDVFQLRRFRGPHADWKPFVAHIMGFDADILIDHYAKQNEIAQLEGTERTIQDELVGSSKDITSVEGMLQLKQSEVEEKQRLIDAFDFRREDLERTRQLVDDIDRRIAALNSQRYSYRYNLNKIENSLNEAAPMFDADEAAQLFSEAGVLFTGQIRRDFEQLVEFNRAISEERHQYLQEERDEIEDELAQVDGELGELGQQRLQNLAFIQDTDVFHKYQQLTEDITGLKATVMVLENQRKYLNRLQELREQIRDAQDDLSRIRTSIEREVRQQASDRSSRFSHIRMLFSETISTVLDRQALLTVPINSNGNIEFHADILDEGGQATSESSGHTYHKLLCVAFDIAVTQAHTGDGYPQFIYHDGLFESLDDRKKDLLLGVVRAQSDAGVQQIITLIDSDLPPSVAGQTVFDDREIVLHLHDEGPDGRLFKMDQW